VRQSLESVDKWATIDDLVDHVVASVGIPDEVSQHAVRDSVARTVRQQIKTFKDADGLAQFESIEVESPDGTTVRVYKQLSLFNKDDYRLSIHWYSERGRYYCRKANTLAKRCNKEHRTQMPLPFPTFGILTDEEAAVA